MALSTPKVCSIDGCNNIGKYHTTSGNYYLLKGLCNLHYQRKINNVQRPNNKRRMKHRLYPRYRNMINRCYNVKSPRYGDWGGRGISVHPEWKNLMDGFEKFAAYMEALPNAYGKGLSMDRIDNDGNYEPGNLRWANGTTQNRNRRNNKSKRTLV